MSSLVNPSTLSENEIEAVEKLTARWVFHALLDFGMEAHQIFVHSPDEVKDVAEDVTREMLDRLPGYTLRQRIYGTVDYKKARYLILPDYALRQALFIDSKAEQETRSATIQMSQTSMDVRQVRANEEVRVSGFLAPILSLGGLEYLTTTAVVHFYYEEIGSRYHLREARVVSLPNGRLQDRYNPNTNDGFWGAGRNAPSLGEKFRVRVNFGRLRKRAGWRVQTVRYNSAAGRCEGTWAE